MAGPVTEALETLGVNTGGIDPVGGLTGAISEFTSQNLSPADIYRAVEEFPRTVGGAFPEIGARLPGVGRIPLPFPKLPAIANIPDIFKLGSGGAFESTRYAHDLNRHQPKLKFLFKVGFQGFATRDFYYFVHRCDKPRVKFNHQDVNFYNFRSRVLTSVTYDPLNITFLDEITNSVHDFFATYLKNQSGTGGGNYGIDGGFGAASSTKPYSRNRGYSTGRLITLEQVFANGTRSNRFHFINPRIESFEFDELTMEESAGSMMSLAFSYDAIQCETVSHSVIHTWGETDLLRGGGTSGVPNAGDTSIGGNRSFFPVSGGGSGIDGGFSLTKQVDSAFEALQDGLGVIGTVPGALADMVSGGFQELNPFNHEGVVGSAVDTLSANIQDTLQSITSGDNLEFSGREPSIFNDRQFEGGADPVAETFPVDLSSTTVFGKWP